MIAGIKEKKKKMESRARAKAFDAKDVPDTQGLKRAKKTKWERKGPPTQPFPAMVHETTTQKKLVEARRRPKDAASSSAATQELEEGHPPSPPQGG